MNKNLEKYGSYSREELINELEVLKRKKYGLVWDKKNSQEALDTFINWQNMKENLGLHTFPILKEIKSKDIISNKSEPTNILIEGDNYHSLAVLNFTHKEAVDVIYIDPPYNTGNKDFIFNDSYVDRDDSYRHSKWLSFMEKRLKLAKNLLKDTGVIFVSIDDNEFAQLKLLMDEPELFGEKNFEAFIWKKKGGAGNTEKIIGTLTEYVLCFFKKKQSGIFNYRDLDRIYKYKDGIGPYNLAGLEKTNMGAYERKTMQFPIIDPKTGTKFFPASNMRWTIGEKNAKKVAKEGGMYFDYKKKKVYLIVRPEHHEKSENVFYNLLLDVGSLATAKNELYNFFGNREIFDTPKPTSLIKHLLEISSKKESVILDFFAGSGTTAQAVLELNKEDGGNRKFILCTDNENNICTNICYPRVEKVIRGYTTPEKEKITGLGGNLKYFKTDFVGAQPTDKNKRDLVNKSTEMLCVREDIFTLKKQKDLDFKIFQRNEDYLGVIFNEEAIDDFVKEANNYKGNFIIYCFSYGEFYPEKEFVNGMKNIFTVKPIPETILKIYREIFKK